MLQSINKIHNVQNITRIYALSKRNVILRYKNSLVGFFWGFFKPLLYLLIFIVIFASQFPSVNNYILYATSGLIFWFFFSNVTNQAIGTIVGSAGLIKSLNIPVMFFPISELIGELFNFFLTLVVFLIVMYWFGITYSFRLFLIVPCAILFSVFTLGVILLLSSLNVFFRDINIIWGTVQPALFYITPIAYPESLLKGQHAFIIKCNPIYYFIKLGRGIFNDPVAPSAHLWSYCIVIATIMFFIGAFVFNKLKNQFISTI